MFVDKNIETQCQECGEQMVLVGDYGVAGQALECKLCGFSIEHIDLHETTLSEF